MTSISKGSLVRSRAWVIGNRSAKPAVSFTPLTTMLESLRLLNYSLQRAGAPAKSRALRGSKQQDERMRWQGAVFAYAYTQTLSIPPWNVWIEMAPLDSAHDMTMNWPFVGGSELKVQLKELPPTSLNPKLTAQQLVDKVSAQYPHDGDMVLAFFMNRTEYFTSIQLPEQLGVLGIWFYGFSQPNGLEVFLKGRDARGSREGFAPFLVAAK